MDKNRNPQIHCNGVREMTINRFRFILFVAILAVVIFFCWAAIPLIIIQNGLIWPFAEAAQFGDYFGVLNTLFSAFAFLGLLYTIKSQSDDQHRQRFESSFFQLLDLMRRLRAEIAFGRAEPFGNPQGDSRPRDFHAIDQAVLMIEEHIDRNGLGRKGGNPAEILDAIKLVFTVDFDLQSQLNAGPYVRVIINMLGRIRDDSVLSEEEKFQYARLLRGQLTGSEAAFLGTTAIIPASSELKPLLEQFRMLKYTPNPIRGMLLRQYNETAFSSSRKRPAR
ncbi:hypothetical protein OSH08_21375 [Kaistia geumhonensis]|uniref:Phage abortive infection protein n=1 Tax=Kaistia geumhonensis TaxID=410839 RepID=A0ABU0MCE5_9HYPH|nr:putative phage abortive infection protein [Kaistia geumhonensis]MCX5481563.1 hypothetical protein [Kaistia geumhonensis]MDQ0518629.1 hypothetical protein [Kaistia geumhonensis]